MIRSFSAPQLAHWKSACGSISPGLVSRHFVISVNAMQPTLIKGRCACTGSIDWTCQATIATNSSCRMLYIGRIVASADASEKKSLSCIGKVGKRTPLCTHGVLYSLDGFPLTPSPPRRFEMPRARAPVHSSEPTAGSQRMSSTVPGSSRPPLHSHVTRRHRPP